MDAESEVIELWEDSNTRRMKRGDLGTTTGSLDSCIYYAGNDIFRHKLFHIKFL